MTPLAFYLLLTLHFQTGTKGEDGFQQWTRIVLMTSDPAADYNACERAKPNLLNRVKWVWDQFDQRADATTHITAIDGTCVGIREGALPATEIDPK